MDNKLLLVTSAGYVTLDLGNERVRIGEHDMHKDEAIRLAKTIVAQYEHIENSEKPEYDNAGRLLNPRALVPTTEELRFISERKLIQAIKALRERTHMGLKDAKDLIEYWRDNPIPF